jgi:acetyl-CoA synthetase
VKVSQHRDKPQVQGRVTAFASDPYAQLHGSFRWRVPKRFNIAQVCCRRWANSSNTTKNVAAYAYYTLAAGLNSSGKSEKTQRSAQLTSFSYAQLQRQANRLSNVLKANGVGRGDRVAIVMPQRFETAVAYIAVLQMGAVAMPLSMLFGPEALEYRLNDSEAVLAICDAGAVASVQSVRAQCRKLQVVIGVEADDPWSQTEGAGEGTGHAGPFASNAADIHYATALEQASHRFTLVSTLADDPAILIYTSGTTGQPKGALLAHRALIGNLTGFVCSQNWFGFDGKSNASSDAVFWSPADWAWTGGLMDALLPTLYFGRPIVAFNGRFSPQTALELMRDCGVTYTFIFPTALKAMMKAYPGSAGVNVRQQFKLKLQAIMSAGEAVGDAVFGYCATQLGVRPNEMFGQTEINYIVGNCNKFWPSKPGSMGKAYPGHRVQVIDDDGNECPVGTPGDVAVNRFDVHGHPDPVFFLGYWKNDAATQAKYCGKNGADDWCRTGDLATRDADGYLWYQGRSDDVFKAAGYRIGPGEVENCLVKHPAVANAAVVPKPDAARGAVVKAYVVLAPDFVSARACYKRATALFDADLIAELQTHVKGKLAPYEYPKEIEFVDELPMTTTGKVQRRVLRLQEEARARALSGA